MYVKGLLYSNQSTRRSQVHVSGRSDGASRRVAISALKLDVEGATPMFYAAKGGQTKAIMVLQDA